MYQNYGYQQQQQSYQMSRPTYPIGNNPGVGINLKGRPVTSLEEARASMIDFDGSIFYFPDQANKKIYTKQINMDGTANIQVYELVAMPVAQSQNQIVSDYITRQEFEQAINQLREGLAPQQPVIQQSQDPISAPAAGPKLELNF